jgi:hypothetical protein
MVLFYISYCLLVEDLRYSDMNLLKPSTDGGHEKLFSNGERFLMPFLLASSELMANRKNYERTSDFLVSSLSD